MKIALLGASGMIGRRILEEAKRRGHAVTSIGREQADILDADRLAAATAGNDVVISAFGPGQRDPKILVDAAKSLIEVSRRNRQRVVVVSGAGSLEVAPGVDLVDTPNFPAAWKGLALAHRDALNVFKASDVNWTAFSPAAMIEPGDRTGKFRIGTDQLIVDGEGESRISAEDYAVALIDEVESPKFERTRFTVGY